jgi:hypothetical protein
MWNDSQLKQLNLLIERLERLSADSILSHRASGIRGSLLGYLEEFEGRNPKRTSENLNRIMEQGYHILEQAVKLCFQK